MAGRHDISRDRGSGSVHVSVSGYAHTHVKGAHSAGSDQQSAQVIQKNVNTAGKSDNVHLEETMAGRHDIARDQDRGSGSVNVSVSGYAHTHVQGAHSAGSDQQSAQVMAKGSSSKHEEQRFETALRSVSGHAHNHMSQRVEVVQPEIGQSVSGHAQNHMSQRFPCACD
ncbi:uncharacterized protein A4U43_C01F32340 [Asparagus officinalis]|uniref:Uncharacterized protein n=1 Tax=Asparagus officinalis TaxID=4686 RepID=A0A5P1FUS4_ASPOF|nr:uncharacterized protein A4U43_C01F32340 [Asparagus officinalis]